jgi:hypothetical protein
MSKSVREGSKSSSRRADSAAGIDEILGGADCKDRLAKKAWACEMPDSQGVAAVPTAAAGCGS